MANPQPDRYIKISTELFEALCSVRVPGEANQVLRAIIRFTYGFNKKHDRISTSQIQKVTKLTKRAVHRARAKLVNMNLIGVTHKGHSQVRTYYIQKNYEMWKVLPKRGTPKNSLGVTHKGSKGYPIRVPKCDPKGPPQYTIDNKQKLPPNYNIKRRRTGNPVSVNQPGRWQAPPPESFKKLTEKIK